MLSMHFYTNSRNNIIAFNRNMDNVYRLTFWADA